MQRNIYNLLCIFCNLIPIKKLRKKARTKLSNYFYVANNNSIFIYKENGKIIKNPFFVKGFNFVFEGKNNLIELHEPIYSEKSTIHALGDVSIKLNKCSMRSCEFYANFGSGIFIDEASTLGHAKFYALGEKTSIAIGKDCMFSGEVAFWAGDGHTVFNELNQPTNHSKGIIVEDHVWIGQNSCILKNTIIRSNSIIGARSVVAKKFDTKSCAIAGNPARIIKENINWSRKPLYNIQNRER